MMWKQWELTKWLEARSLFYQLYTRCELISIHLRADWTWERIAPLQSEKGSFVHCQWAGQYGPWLLSSTIAVTHFYGTAITLPLFPTKTIILVTADLLLLQYFSENKQHVVPSCSIDNNCYAYSQYVIVSTTSTEDLTATCVAVLELPNSLRLTNVLMTGAKNCK